MSSDLAFIFQPLTLLLADWRIRTGKKVLSTSTPASTAAGGPASSSSSRILAQVALTNFELCKSALKKQSDYWLGIRWVQAVLEKASSRQSIMSATEGINTFVSRHELVSSFDRELSHLAAEARAAVPSHGLTRRRFLSFAHADRAPLRHRPFSSG